MMWFCCCQTLQGKLKSLTKPKSSPVASSFLSLVSEEALTKLSVGQMPSQVGPSTDVHVAHSIFSNWAHTNTQLRGDDAGVGDIYGCVQFFTSKLLIVCRLPRGASKNSCSLAPVLTWSSFPASIRKKCLIKCLYAFVFFYLLMMDFCRCCLLKQNYPFIILPKIHDLNNIQIL